MKKEKLKSFAETHKEIVILGACAIGVAVGVVAAKKFGVFCKGAVSFSASSPVCDDITIPVELAAKGLTELWRQNGYLNAIAENVSAADLGSLGEAFVNAGLWEKTDRVALIIGKPTNV